MTRYFPELVDAFRAPLPARCVLDGEIVVAGATAGSTSGRCSSGCTRRRAGSRCWPSETPARLRRLRPARARGRGLTARPFRARRAALERALAGAAAPVHLTPITRDEARRARTGSSSFEGAGLDGADREGPRDVYQPGKRVMAKIKHVRTADCVLAGYRLHKSTPDAVGSLLLGLHDDGARPRRSGRTTSAGSLSVGVVGAFPMARRRELFAELQPLVCDLAEHPWSGPARRRRGARRERQPLEPGQGPLVRAAAARARARGPLRPHGGRPLPPPAAVRPLAARPRPRRRAATPSSSARSASRSTTCSPAGPTPAGEPERERAAGPAAADGSTRARRAAPSHDRARRSCRAGAARLRVDPGPRIVTRQER